MSTIQTASSEQIPFRRVHGETALFVVSLIIAVLIWAGLAYYTVRNPALGAVVVLYVLLIAGFLFVMRVAFVTNVRGNAARLGPEQFPELYHRVETLAGRMGLKRVPAAYLMQAGGALNALAARFIRTNMVVLYSDLVEACGVNGAALDMIIAHELGHVRGAHVRLGWLLFPSRVVPFLGSALSRAREYTCDLVGFTAAGDREGGLLGLSILAVGATYGPRVAHGTLAAQRRDLNTGWMTLGQWVGTHPPLAKRIAALDPSLSPETRSSAGGTLRALSIMLAGVVILVGGIYVGASGAFSRIGNLLSPGQDQFSGFDSSTYTPPESAANELNAAFAELSTVLDEEVLSGGALPASYDELTTLWSDQTGKDALPTDPYDGQEIGYTQTATGYRLWSSGPDGVPETDDDIVFDGPQR